jgi:CRP/FNR family transcriptional regulator
MTPEALKIVTALRSMELFHDLDTPHLHKLATIATEIDFPEGEIIYREGEAGKAIYLVQVGEIVIEMALTADNVITLFTIGPGQLFGWSSLFPARRKQARARAQEMTQAIVIDAGQLRHMFRSDHKLELAILNRMNQVIAERVYSARLQLAKALSQDY